MRWNSLRLGAITVLLLCAALLWLATNRHGVAAAGSTQESGQAPAQARPRPEFLVIIDASHGGDDNGAALGDKVLEKDLTLALARLLKVELEERGVSVRMLRESDVSLGLERRAEAANEARPSLYVALHAGVPGEGARVYAPAVAVADTPVGPFVPWESAQAASITQSKTTARIVTEEIRKTGMHVREMSTPLRPLNNVTAPAIAVELAIGPQPRKPQQIQKLETALTSSIAAGIVQARNQLGVRP